MIGARAVVVALVVAAALVSSADARQWGWLGVRIRDISEQEMDEVAKRHGIREGFGVVIVEVIDGTPAAHAGLRSGDIVVAFQGRPVTEGRLLQRLIASAPTNSDVNVTVLRSEGRRSVDVRLATMPRAVAGDRMAAEFGFGIREAADAAAPRLEPPSGGLPIIGVVLRDSPAARAGLAVGDLILQIDDRPVVTRDAAREALGDADLERPLTLTVRRANERLVLRLAAP